jgi:hypothetical protein
MNPHELMDVIAGIAALVALLAFLGAAASVFGADSRASIGDDRGPGHRGDWI